VDVQSRRQAWRSLPATRLKVTDLDGRAFLHRLTGSWVELGAERERLFQVLDENANFGGQPAAGGPYGKDRHCSLKLSQKTDDGTFSEFCGEEPCWCPTFVGKGSDGGPTADLLGVEPIGTGIDGFGNHYIPDEKANTIRKVTSTGIVSTFAGTGTPGYSGDGGSARSAKLRAPLAVVVDGAGFVYIADTGNNVVRLVNSAGIISTYAGQYYAPGTAAPPVCAMAKNSVGDGCLGNQIVLNMPVDLVFCNSQNLHISDKLNHRIRTVIRESYRTITQVGNGTAGYNGDGELNTSAELNGPTGLAMDAANYIYIADTANHIIRKTLLTGYTPNPISTIAGTPGRVGNRGDGDPAKSAELNSPHGVQVDAAGNVYISDSDSRAIRKFSSTNGLISTIAD
jgi:trimeric autotransporter adhesin